jgi:hypothetical protein
MLERKNFPSHTTIDNRWWQVYTQYMVPLAAVCGVRYRGLTSIILQTNKTEATEILVLQLADNTPANGECWQDS